MLLKLQKLWWVWFVAVIGLSLSLAPLSADGPPRRKKGAKEGKASVIHAKGRIVMGMVPEHQSPVAAASVPSQGKILAVVIGVGNFQDKGVRPLRYPAKDAKDFAAWLLSVGVLPQNIALLTDKKATFKAVKRTLVQWLQQHSTSRFDSLILFFSGHGVKDDQLYWLLHDSDLRNLDASALRRELLQKNLARLRVKNKLLFVDACYSRATASEIVAQRNQLLPGEAQRGFGGQGSFSLFSSDGNQESLEPVSLKNGLFTHWLLRGLKGEADTSPKDGVLTATELYSFVADNVRRSSASYGRHQDPAQEDSTVGGQLALLRFPNASSLPSAKRSSEAPVEPPVESPKAGDLKAFKIQLEGKEVEFSMRYIPAGSFRMGSPPSEKERSGDERQRQVTITRAFWMMATEVTQGQYKAVTGSNPSHFQKCGDMCPAEQVSWHDAAAFADRLSQSQGLKTCFVCKQDGTCDIPDKQAYLACTGWRLPTEAEWEYTARAATSGRFHTGDCITPDQANFKGHFPPVGCGEMKGLYRKTTTPVQTFQPNPWGLYDMHGNVWEWVADWYASRYEDKSLEDPLQLLESHAKWRVGRVKRGGSWLLSGGGLRSAYRFDHAPEDREIDVGFRLLRSP